MKKRIPDVSFLRGIDLLDISNLIYENTQEFAQKMDTEDPLALFQEEFNYPKNEKGEKLIYFCGNSLGLQPKGAVNEVGQIMQQWESLGVKGHFNGTRPWVKFHLSLKESMAKVVGANADEVTLMNTLSVNLHLMLTSFYRPEGKRTKILIEEDVFPSDRYAIESHIEWHKLNVSENLVIVPKDRFSENIKTSAIESILAEKGDEIALIILGGINYYTGQLLNIAKITALGHSKGCLVGFDLAHAAGNVPLNLNSDNVDFAVWCTYKYLNAGPGSIAGAFVHERNYNDHNIPKLKGWWGHNEAIRFGMRDAFDPMHGVESWQISCQPILSLAPLKASLELLDKAGMKALRNKSVLLTGFLEFLLKKSENKKIKMITSEIQNERGCQLSLKIEGGDKEIYHEMVRRGFVIDWRNPNVIRVAPNPLYNTYEEVWKFEHELAEVLSSL